MRLRFNDGEQRLRMYVGAPAVAPTPGADASPKWNMLFPLGKTKHRADLPGGSVTFTAEMLGSMVANFKKLQAQHHAGSFGLPVDYHHRGTSDPDDDTPQEEKVASGWIEDVELRDDGLHVLIRWTAKARAHIDADEYRYLSPEWAMDWRDSDTGQRQGPTLFGAGLLNDPFLKELPRVAASELPQGAAAQPHNPVAQAAAGAPKMEWLKALLGLPPEATEEQVKAAVQALKDGATAMSAKVEEATQATAKMAELRGSVTKFADENKALSQRVEVLEKEKREGAATAFVEGLVREGKVLPAQSEAVRKLAFADLETARAIYKDAKPVIEFKEQGVTGKGGDATPTREEARVQLRAKAAELAKEHSLPMSEATIRAMALNPALAKQLEG